MKRILITTPIYYVNDKPHWGHAYTTLAADVLVRYFRLQKKGVFFLTGTDEHGAKIVESAKKSGITPKELCDKNSKLFKEAWKNLNIKYDYFVRTTDKKHEDSVKKFMQKLKDEKVIYEKAYQGLYCTGCEKFITEKELENGKCPFHQKTPEKISEKNYFFKLSNYLDKVKKIIENDKLKIKPEGAKKEVLGLFKQGLDDFSISRQKVKWGIPLPFDKSQIVYVWAEALQNYISAIGYGDDHGQFKKWWKESKVIHLIGRDILKFHAIYWPALLLAVGEKVPDEEFIHGFFTINGQKMSKSLGNIVDPNEVIKEFGVDATRYLLLSQFPFGQDGDVKQDKFDEKYNADLANGLGNLVARVLTLATRHKIQDTRYKPKKEILKKIEDTRKNYKKAMEEIKLHEALGEIWKLISFCDEYVDKNKPWKLAKTDKKKLKEVLSNLLYCISEIANLIEPFLPETSEKIKKQLKSGKPEILFPRL